MTVPADSLLGVGDTGAGGEAGATAELAGHGPIPIADARALAFLPGSVWFRLLTDPATGRVVERSTTAYRPGAALTELVRSEHGTCVHPGCRMPAHRCDLDHVVPFDATSGTGPTSAGNLRPLCRSHHRLKHSPGWKVVLRADGGVEWSTPSGHVHVAGPSPVGPVRPTNAQGRRGPGVLELMRDPGLATRLATNTAEAPF
ncbi:HNH endonuclease signature motif containing protein [Pseudonocardia sp. NPDC049635]|uniref:HNH endonuclease signature motif containing protein n=1 Tax=Pseudonocardia sp. NPDC049635 TaxID=3155506 RepID=UPI00340B0D13